MTKQETVADSPAPDRRPRRAWLSRWPGISAWLTFPLHRPLPRTCLIAGAVATLDFLMPLGVTAAALYMAAVLSAVPIRHPRAVILTAVACSILLAIDAIVSPGRGHTELWKVVVNHLIALVVVWGTALMADAWIRVQRQRMRQAQENQLLLQAMSLSVMSNSFEEALRSCVGIVCEIVNWPVGHIYFHDAARQQLVSSDIWTIPNLVKYLELRRLSEAIELSPGEGVPGQVLESRQPRWFSELNDPRFIDTGLQIPLHGAYALPIIADDDVIAVVEFFSHSSDAPEPQMLLLVDSVGKQLGQVAERRRLVAERSRIAAIVESSYDAIIGRDLDGRIISWNTGAELVYGYSEEEALGRTVEIIMPIGVTAEEHEITAALHNRRRLTQFETKRRRKNGQVIDVALTVSPILDSLDQLIGSSTIERDVTLRRRREQELQAAREAAEYANQAKSAILANVSHELRTPMNAVLGMLELALSEPLPDGMRDYLDTARDSARTLLHLLNDLLDVSRMEAGGFELEIAPFDVREVLEARIRALSIRASEKGLELVLRMAGNVPKRLIGDGFRLGQIVTNLAGNALKFTEQGEVVLDVSVTSQDGKRVELHISVRDTGVGIAPEHQEQIFAPFSQVDPSTTRRHSGSGLGLAICSEIVSKMDGRIWLDSQLGQGSTFHCTVWMDQDEATECTPNDWSGLAGRRVLVVDDNAVCRRFLCDEMDQRSMSCCVADGGQSGLEVLESACRDELKFDAIIVDALMPGMDGFSFAASVHSRYPDAHPPIILMLASSDRQTFRTRTDELKIAALLEKPVTTSALLETLNSAVLGIRSDNHRGVDFEVASQSRRVLLVEDMPANQKFMRAILEGRGHQVRVAGNGREAIEQIKHAEFDVVLMDVQMPTMDGFQATQAIRNLEGLGRDVPIIALTAHARREDRQKCFASGMDAMLEKPVSAAEVVRLVESIGPRSPAAVEMCIEVKDTSLAADNGRGSACIDLDSARKRMDRNETLLIQMAGYYLEDVPRLIAELTAALDRGDAQNAQRIAHSIKGLAANFGAGGVTTAAQQIEDLSGQGGVSEAQSLLGSLSAEVTRAERELRSELKL